MKVVAFTLLLPFLVLALFFFRSYLVIPQEPMTFFFLLPVIVLSSILFFFMALAVGFLALFLEDARGFGDLLFMLIAAFSGQFAPISFFPESIQQFALFLPFQYLIFFPMQVYLEQLTQSELLTGMSMQLLWIAVMSVCATLLWIFGIRRYSAVGR